MTFQIEELFEAIMNSDLPQEEQIMILGRLFKRGRISESLYLKREEGTEEFECWQYTIDENGQTVIGPTDFAPQEMVDAYIAGKRPVTRVSQR